MIQIPPAALEETLQLAVQIQQIPAPTFAEAQRATFVSQFLSADPRLQVESMSCGNVLARLPGGNQKPLVVSAHLDTVFPADTSLNVRREDGKLLGPGLGDNSLGVAVLCLLPSLLADGLPLPGDLWLAATVCEEGLGNLIGMRGLVERFDGDVRGYIALEGLGLGNIMHRGLGVRRYRIRAHTAGGHSWVDAGTPSALHELAGLVTRLAALPLSKHPRTTLNVGRMEGGTSINTIASSAWFELDLRSESGEELERLDSTVLKEVARFRREGVQISADLIGSRPAGQLSLNAPLIHSAAAILTALGFSPHFEIASTEANLPLSLGFPALTLGLTTGGCAHTTEEYIHTAPVAKGLRLITGLIARAWNG